MLLKKANRGQIMIFNFRYYFTFSISKQGKLFNHIEYSRGNSLWAILFPGNHDVDLSFMGLDPFGKKQVHIPYHNLIIKDDESVFFGVSDPWLLFGDLFFESLLFSTRQFQQFFVILKPRQILLDITDVVGLQKDISLF